jgi:fructose-specific phosphotransferase system IIC component
MYDVLGSAFITEGAIPFAAKTRCVCRTAASLRCRFQIP